MSSTSPTARASPVSLPPEVMRHIVEDASDWDQLCLDRHPALAASRAESNQPNFGHSVSALSLVSKSWRAQTEDLLFKTVSSKQAEEPIFALRIQHRYGRYISTADFTHHSRAHDVLAATLPPLTALRSLRFDEDAFGALFNTTDPTMANMRWDLFREIAPRITNLSLGWMRSLSITLFLPLFASLQILELCALPSLPTATDWLEAVTAVAAMSQLKKLTMRNYDEHESCLPDGWELLDWTFRRTLLTLRLHLSSSREFVPATFTLHDWMFVEHFAETLQVLDLSFEILQALNWERSATGANQVSFLALRECTISAAMSDSTRLLDLLRRSPIETLTLQPERDEDFNPTAHNGFHHLFDTALKHFSPTLRRLVWHFPHYRSTSDFHPLPERHLRQHMRDRCSALGIHLELHGTYDPFDRLVREEADLSHPELLREEGPKDRKGDWENRLQEQAEAARKVLNSAEQLVTRLERSRDCEGLDSLMKTVLPLRARMLLEEH